MTKPVAVDWVFDKVTRIDIEEMPPWINREKRNRYDLEVNATL